jgi:tetratricopeptide (TPR) repeat protein
LRFNSCTSFFLVVTISLINLAPISSAQVCDGGLGAAHGLFDQGQYETALDCFKTLAASADCDNECRGEALFYAAYSLYHLGNDSAALHELRQSIMLRPKRKLIDDVYPARIYELYEQARSELLCTIEIHVATPGKVAMMDGDRILLSCVRHDVPAGTLIKLEQSKYAPYSQPYILIPGQVNRFQLELKQIIGTNFLALKHTVDTTKPIDDRIIHEDGDVPYLLAKGHRVDFQREYYYDSLLTHLVIGEDSTAIHLQLSIIEGKPEWSNLIHHLDKNPKVRKWFGRFKLISGVGLITAAGISTYFNSQANDEYDVYLNALPDQTYRTYRDYEHHIALRNIFGATALTFLASELVWFLGNPKDEASLIDEFSSGHTGPTLSLDYRQDYVGLKLAYAF